MGPACAPTASIGIGCRISSMAEGRDLTVDLGRGLRLRSPVLVASGTFGYGFDAPQVDRVVLGAIVTKGTTLRPREGNVPNRIAETPSGMLNAIGLQNPGVDHVAGVYAPVWASWNLPMIVNVAGDAIDEDVAVARRLPGVPGGAGPQSSRWRCTRSGRWRRLCTFRSLGSVGSRHQAMRWSSCWPAPPRCN